jgi:hypothetical protein
MITWEAEHELEPAFSCLLSGLEPEAQWEVVERWYLLYVQSGRVFVRTRLPDSETRL